MTTSPKGRALALLAVSGPVVFTAAWWVLGTLTPGYVQSSTTISAIAMVGRPHATAMLVAFAWQGCAQLATAAVVLRHGHRRVSAAVACAGAGTLAVAALPLPGAEAATWLGVAHTVAAVLAFGGLHAAALLGALDRGLPRWVRVLGGTVLAIALPHTAWFVGALAAGATGYGSGYAEKLMTTVLLVFTTAVVAAVTPRRRRVP